MLRTIAHFLATLCYVSYYVYAPGTVASLITAAIIFFVPLSVYMYTVVMLLSFFIAYYSIKYALPLFCEDDPSCIVIDECVGCLVAFYGLPTTLPVIVVGLVLFRFFDISKVGIAPLQKLAQARGVLADDIAAGLITNCLLRLMIGILL